MKRGILILLLFVFILEFTNAESCLIENYVPNSIINIKEGWNLLSFPVENSINITNDLQNENCLIFKAFEYNINTGSFTERKILESGKFYYLYSIKSCSFNLSNFIIKDKTNVNLNYGWNIVPGSNNLTKVYPNMNGIFWIFGNSGYESKLSNLTSFDAGWIFLNSSRCKRQIEIPPIGKNKKNMNKYSEDLREVFLVSDKNWKDVLSLVPVTTFTQQTGDNSNCQRGYGTPDKVCVYPTLVWHDEVNEKNAFDIDSSIYFMQQFNTEKVKVVGEIPEELNNLLIAEKDFGAGISQENVQRINIENYLSYWESYEDVVYVQDDYELSLVASTYASLLNAPLIIKGTELDVDEIFNGRNIICITNEEINLGRTCNENYNLETLQQKYVDMTEVYDGIKTDKIILTNPNDLDIFVSEEFYPEKSANPVYEIYGKTSLASPILAGAKHEIIITTRESDYQKVDEKIESEVGRLMPEISGGSTNFLEIFTSHPDENPTKLFLKNISFILPNIDLEYFFQILNFSHNNIKYLSFYVEDTPLIINQSAFNFPFSYYIKIPQNLIRPHLEIKIISQKLRSSLSANYSLVLSLKGKSIKTTFLTIFASPDSIQFSKDRTDYYFEFLMKDELDSRVYGSFKNYDFIDFAVGRIMGISPSDSSSYISRVLSLEYLSKNNNALIVVPESQNWWMQKFCQSNGDYRSCVTNENLLMSYTNKFYSKKEIIDQFETTSIYTGFLNVGFTNKDLIYNSYGKSFLNLFEDHGVIDGVCNMMDTSYLKDNSVFFNPGFFINIACLTCDYNEAKKVSFTRDLFCTQGIRRGMLFQTGAVSVAYWMSNMGYTLEKCFLENKTIGEAYTFGKNQEILFNKENPSSFLTFSFPKGDTYNALLGDPTFKPKYW